MKGADGPRNVGKEQADEKIRFQNSSLSGLQVVRRSGVIVQPIITFISSSTETRPLFNHHGHYRASQEVLR